MEKERRLNNEMCDLLNVFPRRQIIPSAYNNIVQDNDVLEAPRALVDSDRQLSDVEEEKV